MNLYNMTDFFNIPEPLPKALKIVSKAYILDCINTKPLLDETFYINDKEIQTKKIYLNSSERNEIIDECVNTITLDIINAICDNLEKDMIEHDSLYINPVLFIYDSIQKIEKNENLVNTSYIIIGKQLSNIIDLLKTNSEINECLEFNKAYTNINFYPIFKYNYNEKTFIIYIDEDIDDETIIICGDKNKKDLNFGLTFFVFNFIKFDESTNKWYTQYTVDSYSDHPENHYIIIKLNK